MKYLAREEHQYAPFIGTAIAYALLVGFPLGLLLAHAAAQGSALGGRFPQLIQVHGHIQLIGWFGLFVMGMGYRLIPRFTALRLRYQPFVPLTLVLVATGLALRAIGQTYGDREAFSEAFAASGVLEFLGVALFVAVVLRALILGRPDEFGYKPFFAAGAAWLAAGALLNAYLVLVAARDGTPVIVAGRSWVAGFMFLYGFVAMFVLAVSVRTFPIFFGRERPNRTLLAAAFLALNGGIALYAGGLLWWSYERSDLLRHLQNAGFLLTGVGLLAMVLALGIFSGTPHRLRESARRNMRFVRSAYAWLALSALLHLYFAASAIAGDRPVHAFQADAVRHFIALGFLMTVTIGMAFLVMPALAMRRLAGRPVRIAAVVLLALLHAAAAARGAGSLMAQEGRFEEGYWTMSAGGVFAILVLVVFLWYLLRNPAPAPGDAIPVAERA